MCYETFRDEQLKLQLDWRKGQNIASENGFQNGKQYDHIVPKSEWQKTIWSPLEKPLLDYLKNGGIQRHTGTHNLLSSWVLCSNLYLGIH